MASLFASGLLMSAKTRELARAMRVKSKKKDDLGMYGYRVPSWPAKALPPKLASIQKPRDMEVMYVGATAVTKERPTGDR